MDMSVHYHKECLTFDLAGFYNKINHYIFISPTGEATDANIPIYRYNQANSVLFGGEAGFHIHPAPISWLHFKTTFSMVIGKKENGDYLPFIPAHKFQEELRAEKEKLLFLTNAYFSICSLSAFDQTLTAPEESSTSGYTLLDIGAGGNLHFGKQPVEICFQINNIMDKKYIDHLSTLKEINGFNPGRNLSLNFKVPLLLRNSSQSVISRF
jgi:iron complex outermembrane receptor protein